jgi:hypothetical protein
MNPRQGSSIQQTTLPWPRPETNGVSANGPPAIGHAAAELEPVPDLSGVKRSVRHLGSDWLGLARVIIACTNALLVALRRIERRLGG